MSNTTKQQCSICGSPDHTHLHCYGMQAQGAISSKDESSFAFRFAKMWHDLIGSPVMNTRRYTEAQGMMEEADAEIARLRTEHEEFVLKVAERFRGSPVETKARLCECIPLAPRPYKFCQDCGGQIPVHQQQPFTGSAQETSEELNCTTCGKPLDDHGGMGLPCPLSAPPEKASVPRCPWCGGQHIGTDCKAEKANAEVRTDAGVSPASHAEEVPLAEGSVLNGKGES